MAIQSFQQKYFQHKQLILVQLFQMIFPPPKITKIQVESKVDGHLLKMDGPTGSNSTMPIPKLESFHSEQVRSLSRPSILSVFDRPLRKQKKTVNLCASGRYFCEKLDDSNPASGSFLLRMGPFTFRTVHFPYFLTSAFN